MSGTEVIGTRNADAPKGSDERRRRALMAAWTKANGKNDALNPYSRLNYDVPEVTLPTDAPLPKVAVDLDYDARKRIQQAIVARQGQGKFRGGLLRAYDSTCAVTGCVEEEVLEAAHIKPHLGPHTNSVTNGLLLRADIHTLFDRSLLSFDSASSPPKVVVAPSVREPAYRLLHGKPLRPPIDPSFAPNTAALLGHRKLCDW